MPAFFVLNEARIIENMTISSMNKKIFHIFKRNVEKSMKRVYILFFVFCTCIVSLSSGQSNSSKQNAVVEFRAFPNPVSQGVFTITTADIKKKEVVIYSLLGKVVLRLTFSERKKQFDVSQISQGVYLIQVNQGNKKSSKKLIIR